ncbi:MAG TPA: PepSY-associated TM helix domain-containing protein [Usitatibacter sp.]|nr:PepSY-associated TM helix domain-containing protein [Usitatibacter sp.]
MTRGFWVQVHLWLGLTLGVLGIFVGLSGSVLVFDREIDGLLNPQRYRTSGGPRALGYGEYLERASRALEGRARPAIVRAPEQEGEPVIVLARAKEEGGGFARVYLDPSTGGVLDVSRGGGFIGWVHSFHENLTLRELHGREIVGAVGIAMLVSSLSGICLWWPGRARFVASLRMHRAWPLSRNLHYLSGFYGFVVLAMLSFTGIFLAYGDAGRAFVSFFTPVSAAQRNVTVEAPGEGTRRITVDEAITIAANAFPDETLWSVGLPQGPNGTYRVNLSEPGIDSPQPARGIVLFIDPHSGAIVRRVHPSTRTSGDSFLAMQRALHMATPFGVAGRLVTCVVGLLPGLFVATGSLMWLRKRRVRARTLSARSA